MKIHYLLDFRYKLAGYNSALRPSLFGASVNLCANYAKIPQFEHCSYTKVTKSGVLIPEKFLLHG